MDKMIVATFDSEARVYEASRELRDLSIDGTVLIYSGVVIKKDADGEVHVRAIDDEGPVGTAVGLAFGSLFGAIAGGPVGMLAGTAIGGCTGLYADAYNYDRGSVFVNDVAEQLGNGECALVVQVDEEWTAPVDNRLEKLGGTVVRHDLETVENEQLAREIEAEQKALDELENELEQASEETRAELRARVDAAREKLKQARETAKAKFEAFKSDAHVHVEALEKRL